MLVKKKPVSLSLNSRVNLRLVGTTTIITTAISPATTIMVRKEGILTISRLIATKEHRLTMEVVGRVM